MSVFGIIMSVALTVVTLVIESRLSERETAISQETSWRTNLKLGSQFPGADLHGLQLPGLYAANIDLSGADASGADLSHGNFVGARFDGADLSGASLADAHFVNASLDGADLRNASFVGATLDSADLRLASVSGADFSGADLWQTDVRGVDLRGTKLSPSSLRGVCWDDTTRWPAGDRPTTRLCPPQSAASGGSQAEQWEVQAVAGLTVRGRFTELAKSPSVGPGDASALLVRFTNLGKAPVRSVNVIVDLRAAAPLLTVKDVTLFNSNYPHGYRYKRALQANGTQVNVGIDDYGGGGGAYLEIHFQPLVATTCGTQQVAIPSYATPQDRGTVTDSVTLTISDPAAC